MKRPRARTTASPIRRMGTSVGDGWREFSRPELWAALAVQRLPRRPLRRVPRRRLPAGARRARGRMLHARRVERRTPAALVVLGQLKVVTLAVHADGDVADTGPGVEPCAERPEGSVIRGARKRREAERCSQELAAL